MIDTHQKFNSPFMRPTFEFSETKRETRTRTSGNSTDDTLQDNFRPPSYACGKLLRAEVLSCYFRHTLSERTIKYISVTAEDKQETWNCRVFECLLWRLVKPTRVNQIELISALLEVTLACANFNLRIMQQSFWFSGKCWGIMRTACKVNKFSWSFHEKHGWENRENYTSLINFFR